MSFNLEKKVVTCLKQNIEYKFTARDIATWIFDTYPEECRKKQARSTATVIPLDNDEALITQIISEIGSIRPRLQKNHPQIKTTEGRPRKFYYTDKSDTQEIEITEVAKDQETKTLEHKLSEQDLYPLLAKYLFIEHQSIYAKRIDERKSSNTKGTNGNRWLYPDVVALEDLTTEWTNETREYVKETSEKRAKLWSFEVKLLINRSNAREVYFQAVSNSSWANFGYLVAADIEGTDTLGELRILSALHGIGLIKLDVDNPTESQIIIPSRERNEVDWNTANRIATENKDFRDYLVLLKEFHQTGNPRKQEWDIP